MTTTRPTPSANGAPRVLPYNRPDDFVPFDVEAEEAVLGMLLLDGASTGLVAPWLDASDFYREQNAAVYRAILALHRRREAVDFITVKAELARAGELDLAGDAAQLTALLSGVPTSTGLESSARVVKDKADRRRLIQYASETARLAYEDESGDYLTRATSLLESVKAGALMDPFTGAALSPAELLQLAAQPLQFLVPPLVYSPSISVLYGAPGSLKTAIAYDLLMSLATGGAWLPAPDGRGNLTGGYTTTPSKIMMLDLDMGAALSAERFAEVARGHGLTPDQARALGWTHIRGERLSPPLNLADGRSAYHLSSAILTRGVSVFAVDNLGRIHQEDENGAVMARVMGNLRAIVEDTGASCILLHHQRKGGTEAAARKGDTLRGSSAIEASLDLAIHIDRPTVDGVFLDNVTATVTKARRVGSPPFGALYTRAAPSEPSAFRFLTHDPTHDPTSNGAIDAAVRRALEAHGSTAMSQTDLVDAVKASGVKAGEKVIRNRLTTVALDPLGMWRQSPDRGERNAKQFYIP